MKITWQYLAGFFDGEGCIHFPRTPTGVSCVRMQLGQTGEMEHRVLSHIRLFLLDNGIKPGKVYVGTTRKQLERKHWKPCYYLVVSSRQGCADMIRGMLPYLIVKKVIAQDSLRMLVAFPTVSGRISATFDVQVARKLVASGLTVSEVAKRLNLNAETLRDRLSGRHRRKNFLMMFPKSA